MTQAVCCHVAIFSDFCRRKSQAPNIIEVCDKFAGDGFLGKNSTVETFESG
jgi:hypothetical protein